MNPQIQRMVNEAAKGDAWVRPFAMEATIRGGANAGEVFTAFEATADECTKVVELLDKPSIWETS